MYFAETTTEITATTAPSTRKTLRQPNARPIAVIAGRPMLMPRVLPDMMTVMALPCMFSGTSRVP